MWTLSRVGSWQTNHRRTTPTISAPLGEFSLVNFLNLRMVANGTVGAELCRWAVRRVVCDAVAKILGNSDCHLRGNPFS